MHFSPSHEQIYLQDLTTLDILKWNEFVIFFS